jgi:hypothetical protein
MSLELWADDATLQRRLASLGLAGVSRVSLHDNRTVMVSMTRGRVLRLHRGYVYAPDRVLRAVARFLDDRTDRDARRRAERELLAFPAREFVPARQASAPLPPGDAGTLAELARRHDRLNRALFDGRLGAIPFRLSDRMRARLGELLLDERGRRAAAIVISRRHLRRDGWTEVEHTLLHEMVHQWQAENGLPVDHGPAFRRKADEVGVEPRAWRYLPSKRKAAGY